jgi:hypothetical protein
MTQSSYITGENNIFLILGWDKTMSLETATSNRPSVHTIDDRWMNMIVDVMKIDRWKIKVLGENRCSQSPFNWCWKHIHFPRYYILFSLQNNGKSPELLPSIPAKSSLCIPKCVTWLYDAIILTFCNTNYFLNSNSPVQINFPNVLESSVFKQQPISGRSLQKTNINIVN